MPTKCKERVSLASFVSHVNKSKHKLAVKISKHDLAVNFFAFWSSKALEIAKYLLFGVRDRKHQALRPYSNETFLFSYNNL